MADKPLNIETKLDNITLMLAGIAGSITEKNGETGLQFKNFKTIQALNRMGLASKILDSYSFSEIENEKLRTENERMKAIIEYIGALDYPEILEEEEDHE